MSFEMISKIIAGAIGAIALGVFAWKFKNTELCRP